jgi:aldose 1-epimerase
MLALLTATVLGQGYGGNQPLGPDADGKYEISSVGLRALFIPYGASITNLFINDTNGIERDIVLGFDNATHYSEDPYHPHFGGVPGKFRNDTLMAYVLVNCANTLPKVDMRIASRTVPS